MKVVRVLLAAALFALYLIVTVDAGVSAAQKTEILNIHNKERANPKVKPAKALPKMTWHTAAATSAQKLANTCKFAHNVPKGYGQNLAQGGGASIATLVGLWAAEKNKGFTCQKITTTNYLKIGHYTQMVWAKTTGVGCGLAKCGSNNYLVCNYYPAGNFIGQRPYTPKAKRSVDDLEEEYEFDTMVYDAPAVEARNGCTANATCAENQNDCGAFFDGCESVNCGTCTGSSSCVENNCVETCTPSRTCADYGQKCGAAYDGCSTIDCGACDTGFDCVKGQCVAAKCAEKCTLEQTCENGECVCREGFVASSEEDGCEPASPFNINPNEDLSAWSNNNGNWHATAEVEEEAVDGLTHTPSNQEDIIFWEGSNNAKFSPALKVSASAQFTPSDALPYGLAFRAQDAKNYYAVRISDGQATFVVVRDGKGSSYSLGAVAVDEDGNVEIRVLSLGQEFVVYINGKLARTNPKLAQKSFATGKIGVFAQGKVYVSDVSAGIAKNIKINIGTCDTNAADKLPFLLGLKPSQITEATQPVCKTTRDIAVPATLTVEVASSNFAGVEAVQSSMNGIAESSSQIAAQSEMLLVNAESAGSSFLASGTAVDIAVSVGVVAASAGVSTGVIVGAAVGSVVGAAALVGVAVVVHKKVAKKSSSPQQQEETPAAESAAPASKKPKGAGANVFDHDPNNHSSITGRSPAVRA